MRSVALLACAAAIVLGGCGGTPLSTTQLRSGAGRVCLLAARQTDSIPMPGTPAGSAAFLKRGIAVLKHELAELRTLRPPSALSRDYSTSLSAFSAKLGALRTTLHKLARGEDPVIAIKLLQEQLGPIESHENDAWRALQIPACINR